jgi:electron transfer flavoprotein beta subunit
LLFVLKCRYNGYFCHAFKILCMKILVCVSKVPDTTTKISFTDNDTRFNTANVQWIMNPSDEWYALVRALEIKETLGGTVTLINVGDAENDAIIRKGFALGADDGVRINGPENDAYYVAYQIAHYAKDKGYDLIFTGKETINYNGFMIGGMIAEMLDLPYIGQASKLELADGVATVKREIEGAVETLQLKVPFVISAQKGMAEQRIPNMRGIMAARTKPLQVVQPVPVEELTAVVKYELPPAKQAVKLFKPDEVDKLVEALHNEAKVI